MTTATRLRALLNTTPSGDSVLSTLLKGDVAGHEFHGNQYTAGTGGSESESSDRPSTGNFQLSEQESARLAGVYNDAKEESRKDPNGTVESMKQAGEAAAAVYLAKMLGMDKPASEEADPWGDVRPTLFRGCDPQGAQAMLSSLTTYNGGGGTLMGPGIYASSNVAIANRYAMNPEVGQGGTRVDMWVSPDMKIGSVTAASMTEPNFGFNAPDTRTWSGDAQQGAQIALSTPTMAAMVNGYQALDCSGATLQDTFVIMDRSAVAIVAQEIG